MIPFHFLILLTVISFNAFPNRTKDVKEGDAHESVFWIRPKKASDPPIWGHKNGIRVGLHPMPGPRGLIRVYAPYLGHEEDKMINFIAVEPIPKGNEKRGFSELERSSVDGRVGKIFISSNDPNQVDFNKKDQFAAGFVEESAGQNTLTFYIHCEPFDNGVEAYVRVRFYSNRPYEMELTSFVRETSVPIDNLILTATMGNYARLRNLFLKDSTMSSLAIWPEYEEPHFTDHFVVDSKRMLRSTDGDIYFIAATDEDDPVTVNYSEGTNKHWHYYGDKAVQYWRIQDQSMKFHGLVNGRFTYWASEAPIPGGISFENFELKLPFINGQQVMFGVSPKDPSAFLEQLSQ